jgi:polyferredoxin
MKRTRTARVLAVFFLGVIRGVYIHFDQMRWLQRGREAFLADQGRRFDKIAGYHSAPAMLVAGIIMVAIAAVLYELIAAAIASILPPSTAEE